MAEELVGFQAFSGVISCLADKGDLPYDRSINGCINFRRNRKVKWEIDHYFLKGLWSLVFVQLIVTGLKLDDCSSPFPSPVETDQNFV